MSLPLPLPPSGTPPVEVGTGAVEMAPLLWAVDVGVTETLVVGAVDDDTLEKSQTRVIFLTSAKRPSQMCVLEVVSEGGRGLTL